MTAAIPGLRARSGKIASIGTARKILARSARSAPHRSARKPPTQFPTTAEMPNTMSMKPIAPDDTPARPVRIGAR